MSSRRAGGPFIEVNGRACLLLGYSREELLKRSLREIVPEGEGDHIPAVMNALIKGGVLKNCVQMGKYFVKGLEALKKRFPFIREIRGKGLLLGLELTIEGNKIAEACMQEGLLINCTASKVLRFAPPLTITKREIDRGLAILENVLARQ